MTAPAYLLHHLLRPRPADVGDTALIDGARIMTYAELARHADACAAALAAADLAAGDRVAIVLPKSLEECWAIFGTSRAGGVFVPVNTMLRGPQIRHIVEDSGARLIITSEALYASVEDALDGLDGIRLICAETIAAIAAQAGDITVPRDLVLGEDLAAILYTSGSTGRPKGVMLTHRNLLAGSRIVITYLGITASERILSILPFSFDYGLNQLITAVQQRAVTVLFKFRLGDEIVRAIRDHAITGLAGIPTIWAILTKTAPSLSRTPLPSLRYITNSGGAVPSETVRRLRELLPQTQIFLMYGLTEAFRSTYLPPDQIDIRPTSIGKAIPECEVFAVRADGQRARPGEPGILVHRGPTVSRGYWKRPEDTAQVLRPNPFRDATQGGETVCYSGDLVVEDEDGFFSFVGRADTMIKSSGYRISPTEVEEALMSTRAFRQVAVIGLADPVVGQRVHAVAVSADAADTAATLQAVADMLPAYMVPRAIELVEALPTTPNGKVDYPLLARQQAAAMASENLPAEHPPASAAKPALSDDLIAAHFTRDGDKLKIGGVSVADLAARFGTPLFIYDAGIMRARYRALADALGGFAEIHYSVKANPAPAVIRVLIEAGAGIEIASVGEYLKARAAGADAKRILFAGPGKQVRELEQVVRDGIGEIHLESVEEIERLSAIGNRLGVRVPVALRVNPVAAAQGGAMRMGGKPAPFGFDEEDIESILRKVLAQPTLDLRGVHLFAGTQILDADVLLGQWRHGIDVARRIAALAERPLHTIDLGGGLGIPYFNGDGALDLAHLAAGVPALRAILQQEPLLASARVVVEPGRFLVGPAGLYVMAVNAVKLSRGTRFLVVDGGMHHHLAASGNLGQVIKRDYPVIAPARMTAADLQPATVAGPLCTPLDTLARKVDLPDLAAGDLVAIMQSGAYGLTASPVNFLSHPQPAEVLIDGDRIEAIPAT